MLIDLETAMQFNLFLNSPGRDLTLFNESIEYQEFPFNKKEIKQIVNDFKSFTFTEENVNKVMDFLVYMDFVHLDKVMQYLAEEYIFKKHMLIKELMSINEFKTFITKTCREYISKGVMTFVVVSKIIEYFECDELFKNEKWTLKEIGSGVYGLAYFGNESSLTIPSYVEEVYLDNKFDNIVMLHPGVKVFKSGHNFNKPIRFHVGIVEIELGTKFNQTIALPSTLKKFKTVGDFDHSIAFPNGLEELELGSSFNKKIKLPQTLKKFTVGRSFSQSIELVEGLEDIDLGYNYPMPIKLPSTIKKAVLRMPRSDEVNFPEGIEEIILMESSKKIKVPSTVKVFKTADTD